MVST
ncbi:unnamed protein product, partial [Candida parapsilosis]|jgi:hypothetical protein